MPGHVRESINEPSFENVRDATAVSLLEELNTAFVNIVRGSGGQNARRPPVLLPLHTGGLPQANLDSLSNTASKLADPNLIVTVHYYGFWPFGVNIAGSTKFDSTGINDIATVDDGLYNTFG